MESGEIIGLFRKAIADDNAALFRQLIEQHPDIKAKINDPVGPFDSPVITMVRSREMLDAMLAAGADVNARSRWWAGGFGILDNADPALAFYAIERGAVPDIHAAARLGMSERVRELVSVDPSLVHTPGGDGKTPLHCAGSVEIADYLLDHGARIDARDVDHESTPAQYMVRDRQEVLRYLIQRGCQTDILMASAIGDANLVRRLLDENPEVIRVRVNDQYFPKANQRSGGTIYQWTLGWHVSAHDVAKEFGHSAVSELLMQRSPPDVKLMSAFWSGDEVVVKRLLSESPNLVSELDEAQRVDVANAARNNDPDAVRLMLAGGLFVDTRGQHGGTALHWACFHGNREMAREILRYGPTLELRDHDFHATPIGWAIHGSEHGWHCRTGDYAGTVRVLLSAGAERPEKIGGTEKVQEELRTFRPGAG